MEMDIDVFQFGGRCELFQLGGGEGVKKVPACDLQSFFWNSLYLIYMYLLFPNT